MAGLLTALGVHDDVAAREVCANDAQADASSGSTSTPGVHRQCGMGDGLRAGAAVHGPQPRVRDPRSGRRAQRHQRRGWGIPSLGVRNDDQLGSGPEQLRRRTTGTCCCSVRACGAGSTRRRDAGNTDRTVVHHRPVRGLHRRQHIRSGGDRGRDRPGGRAVLRATCHGGRTPKKAAGARSRRSGTTRSAGLPPDPGSCPSGQVRSHAGAGDLGLL